MHCKVTERLFEIIRLLEDEKRKPKDYGTGVLLYHAEAIFLDVIAGHPEENVSGISSLMGVTKGAVTQMARKLLEKGMITIEQRNNNKKEKYYRLTDMGEKTITGHQYFHMQTNQRLCEYISTLTKEETAVIYKFLEHLKDCIPFCEFPCGCNIADKEEMNDESYVAQCTWLESGA